MRPTICSEENHLTYKSLANWQLVLQLLTGDPWVLHVFHKQNIGLTSLSQVNQAT